MNGFRQAIDVPTGSGLSTCAYATVVTVLALVAVVLADIPWVLKALAAGVIVLFAWRELRRLSPGGRCHVVRAVLWQDGSWQVFAVGVQPIGARLVWHWGGSAGPVIGLEWCCVDGVRRRVWLCRTAVSAATWRRLRVRLRLA